MSYEALPIRRGIVGYGKYGGPDYELGVQDDVLIPGSIKPVAATFAPAGKNTIQAAVTAPERGNLRIVMQQHALKDGSIMRSWKGGPPNGLNMGKFFVLNATQNGNKIPVEINYDKVVWSGLSWAVGEITQRNLRPGQPVSYWTGGWHRLAGPGAAHAGDSDYVAAVDHRR